METSENLNEALVFNHSIADVSTPLLFNDELQAADYSERSKPSPLCAENLKIDTADSLCGPIHTTSAIVPLQYVPLHMR